MLVSSMLLADTLTLSTGETVQVMTSSIEIALWILIGLIGISTIFMIVFIIPAIIQLKNTLKEAEMTAKKTNTEILPQVKQMLDDAAPTVHVVMERVNRTTATVDSMISGIGQVTQYLPFLMQNRFVKSFKVVQSIAQFLIGLGNKRRKDNE